MEIVIVPLSISLYLVSALPFASGLDLAVLAEILARILWSSSPHDWTSSRLNRDTLANRMQSANVGQLLRQIAFVPCI